MDPETRKKKEEQLAKLRLKADEAHQKVAENPDDEALQKKAEDAEDKYNQLKSELDAAPADEPSGEDDEKDEDEQDIDFEEELKELETAPTPPGGGSGGAKTELEKAERSLHFNAERVKKLGGDPTKVLKIPKAEAPIDEPAPRDEEELDSRYVTKADLAEQEAEKLSGSIAERKVTMWHYNNSIKRTGNAKVDIENAFYIANKGKIRRSIDEIRRAKTALSAPGTPPGRRPPAGAVKPPQLSSGEQATLRRRGYALQADGSWHAKRYIIRYVVGKGWVTEPKK